MRKYIHFLMIAIYFNAVRGSNYKTWDNYMANSLVPQYIKDQAGYLMECIGARIGMSYSCTSSSASMSNAVSFLRNCGFQSYSLGGYNYNSVINLLNTARPVLAMGYSSKIAHKFLGITIYTTYEHGHAWVIDGYLNRRRYIQKIVETWNSTTGALVSSSTTGYYEYWQMLHNNWGWSGSRNGYFTQGSFNSNNIEESSGTRSNEEYNYQYKREIYYVSR